MESILSKIAEYTIQPLGCLLGHQVGYVIHCKRNLKMLQAELQILEAARESIANEISEAENRGENILPEVRLWLTNVADVTGMAYDFLKDENQAKLKCCGFCHSPSGRYKLSRESTKLMLVIFELRVERTSIFDTVSRGIVLQEVAAASTGEYQAFPSRESTVEEIMAELRNPSTKRIGVYGIAGVGKTTLIEEVYRGVLRDQEMSYRDVILLLDVKENPHPENIQKRIVEKLGMKINESDEETMEKRANRLCGRISAKKVLLILDDVWEKINLKVVGIPDVATCKILVTSRSGKVLSDMNTEKDFLLGMLEEEDAWVLFKKMAGHVVRDPDIEEVAAEVARYCKGLPVLIVTVASALKKRNSSRPWEHALRCLKRSDSEEMTEKAYLGLEWSYHQLNDKKLKELFLLCGITIRGNSIILKDLLRYSVGLGFFRSASTVDEARNALYALVEKLKDVCLLIARQDSDEKLWYEYVRMHDLVCDVANRIVFKDRHMLSSVLHGDGGGLEESSQHLLKLFHFHNLHSVVIEYSGSLQNVLPAAAFKALEKKHSLIVLKGKEREGIVFEEEGILGTTPYPQFVFPLVTSLEFLFLPGHKSFYPRMHTSEWPSLKQLKVRGSGELVFASEISFFQKKHELDRKTEKPLFLIHKDSFPVLEELSLDSACREMWNGNYGPTEFFPKLNSVCFTGQTPFSEQTALDFLQSLLNLERIEVCCDHSDDIFSGDIDSLNRILPRVIYLTLSDMPNLLHLGKSQSDNGIPNFPNLEILQLRSCYRLNSLESSAISFQNLTVLEVTNCSGLKYLISFSVAKSMMHLRKMIVASCEKIKVIVAEDEDDDDAGVSNHSIIFRHLQHVELYRLPSLQGLCSRNCAAIFLSSVTFDITRCKIDFKICRNGILQTTEVQEGCEERDFQTDAVSGTVAAA